LLLLVAVLAAYSNHFQNSFQFDDFTAVVNNHAIRNPGTMLRAFVDADLFSVMPEQRLYRPVTVASLALDYWLGDSRQPFFFHLSTFVWYEVQLVLMFLLFRRIMDRTDPHPSNAYTALIAAAVFGLHPANAETVNYVIQRADLYNALGCIASLWLFLRYPSQRRFCWYLLPAVAAMLAKPPALVFPFLLLVYVLLFEQDGTATLPGAEQHKKWRRAIRSALPALAVAGAAAWLLARMQPRTWHPGAASPLHYWITQPWVALHYFKSFFLPTGLAIDAGWPYADPFSAQALAGYLFVLGLLVAAVAAWRHGPTRPVAFGILWFIVTLLPTSLTPLADVTSDHRMFFPFVGLSLAVCWSLRLALFYKTGRLSVKPYWTYGTVGAVAALLAVAGAATWVRNTVWYTQESLWRDATLKYPRDVRAWTNWGCVPFGVADYAEALFRWERAASLDPACAVCQFDLAKVYIELHQYQVAERCYQRALQLNPHVPVLYIFWSDWLRTLGRFAESRSLLERGIRLNPASPELRAALEADDMEHGAGQGAPPNTGVTR
jgi:tetratricopeptide (TPR) repeat protein